MNQQRPAGLHLRNAILAGLLSLVAVRSTEATVLKNVTLTEQGGMTMLAIEADGPVECQDFLLANPDRLVLECANSTSLLPPKMGSEQMSGRVKGITSEQWTGKDGRPVSRVVCALTGRASYSVAQRSNGLIVILENGKAAADGPGYDEDRLAQSAPMPAPAGVSESAPAGAGTDAAPGARRRRPGSAADFPVALRFRDRKRGKAALRHQAEERDSQLLDPLLRHKQRAAR